MVTFRVLVAEDNEPVNEAVAAGLEAAGFECLRVYDGVEAVRVFRDARPEGLVLDLNLPGLHGLEVLREVKLLQPDVVVVVLTGQGTEQSAIRAVKLGADDYLQKPVRPSVLAASLRKSLERVERERKADQKGAAWARLGNPELADVLFEAPAPVLCLDDSGAVIVANRAAGRLLGFRPDELLGRPLEFLMSPSLRNSWLEAARSEAATGRGYEAEVFLKGAGGDPVPVSAVVVAAPGGGRLVFALRDLTQQRALEMHYFETKKLASLGRVVEGVAHEVRNPLVSIGGFARKLLDGMGGGGGRERQYLEVILSDVQRLERMVREIEGYVEFTHRRRPAFSPVDVGAILTAALDHVGSQFPSSGVTVREERTADLPVLFGDEALLRELFEGLAKNAFEAMLSGGTLSAAWEVEGNWVRLRLTDTGVGIAKIDLDEIFNPFVTTKTSGAGLGLAKAYMIVEEHSGTIEFDSAPGRGTVCSVNLPVDRRNLRRVTP